MALLGGDARGHRRGELRRRGRERGERLAPDPHPLAAQRQRASALDERAEGRRPRRAGEARGDGVELLEGAAGSRLEPAVGEAVPSGGAFWQEARSERRTFFVSVRIGENGRWRGTTQL